MNYLAQLMLILMPPGCLGAALWVALVGLDRDSSAMGCLALALLMMAGMFAVPVARLSGCCG
jgi:hypothetical protein